MFSNLPQKLFSIIIFILLLPVFLFISLIIKLDSPGPIIFTQLRLGKNKKLFKFYKFRTMYKDADKLYPKLYEYKFTKKNARVFKFKLTKDPRLTNFGKKLRKTSLDELPNLINVIKGDMNLVGPRPEIPQMLPYYTQDELKKFSVHPGMTGFAQTNGRGNLTFEQTINYDLKYIREKSLKTDLKLLLKTIKVVIKATGAF